MNLYVNNIGKLKSLNEDLVEAQYLNEMIRYLYIKGYSDGYNADKDILDYVMKDEEKLESLGKDLVKAHYLNEMINFLYCKGYSDGYSDGEENTLKYIKKEEEIKKALNNPDKNFNIFDEVILDQVPDTAIRKCVILDLFKDQNSKTDKNTQAKILMSDGNIVKNIHINFLKKTGRNFKEFDIVEILEIWNEEK